MGEVYKAHDERLNRTIAIKRLFADDANESVQSPPPPIAPARQSTRFLVRIPTY